MTRPTTTGALDTELSIRPVRADDHEPIRTLMGAALGGGPTGENTAAFFEWKHQENPFGQSPGLVAHADGRLVGVRLFLRWELRAGDRTLHAVRAVDTATDPEFQGQGIFRRLTLGLLQQLDEGGDLDLVFNTPNANSRPGYLKMGWQDVGSIPVKLSPVRPLALLRGVRAARATTASAATRDLPAHEHEPSGPTLRTCPFESALTVLTDREQEVRTLLAEPVGARPAHAAEPRVPQVALRPGPGARLPLRRHRVRRRAHGSRVRPGTSPRAAHRVHPRRRRRRGRRRAIVPAAVGGGPPGGCRPRPACTAPGTGRTTSAPAAATSACPGRGSGWCPTHAVTRHRRARPGVVAALPRGPGGVLTMLRRVPRRSLALYAVRRWAFLRRGLRPAGAGGGGAVDVRRVRRSRRRPGARPRQRYLVTRTGRDGDPWLVKLMMIALVSKLVATVARYLMAFVLYNGVTDGYDYDFEGIRLAESYRQGQFDADIGRPLVGTGFIRVLTGRLYMITGPSVYVAYVFFALLGFWGFYFLYKAFRVAVPDGEHRRYAILVMFLPSMLFWPSGLGKEAWMMLGIGLTALGAARLLSGYRHWAPGLLLGLTATALVRPHITAALFIGIAAAMILRKSLRPQTALTPLVRLGSIAAVVAVGFYMVSMAASFLEMDDVSVSGLDAAMASQQERTGQGGSEFAPVAVNSPLDLPLAAFSVAVPSLRLRGRQPADAAGRPRRAALLLGLVALRCPRRSARARLRTQPYLILCLVYTLLFVYAFSNFSNFGILTRQRVQVLPFVLVFLALPRPPPLRRTPAHHIATARGES